MKTLLSHLMAKAVDAGPSAQSVGNLLIKGNEKLTSWFNIATQQ